jgi:hypothetical protein
MIALRDVRFLFCIHKMLMQCFHFTSFFQWEGI